MKEHITKSIHDYLRRNDISQVWLAEKLECSTGKISLMLSNKRGLDICDYIKICEVLEVPLDTFIKGYKKTADAPSSTVPC